MTEFSEQFLTFSRNCKLNFQRNCKLNFPVPLLFSEKNSSRARWRQLGGGAAGFGQFFVTGVVCGLGSTDLAAEELELEAGGARARARGRGGRS
jgi:hypothetical protein